MNEPAAIWSPALVVFDQDIGLTQNVILYQARSALSATLARIETLHNLTVISPHIAPTLSDLCYQAGLASTILFNDAKRGRLESLVSYELRLKRLEYVNYWCGIQGISISTLKDRRVRNALTHIDEHLADALTRNPNAGWFIDVAVETRDGFNAPEGITVNFCRSYIYAEDTIIHLGQEISLAILKAECVALLAVVFGIEVNQLGQIRPNIT